MTSEAPEADSNGDRAEMVPPVGGGSGPFSGSGPGSSASAMSLAEQADPAIAAGGVAGLGIVGMLAGFFAYRGAIQAQARRSANRAALFGGGV